MPENPADPKLAAAAAAVQELLDRAREQEDSPQLASLSQLIGTLRAEAGPLDREAALAQVEQLRAEAHRMRDELATLDDNELLRLARQAGPQANPQELLGLGAALSEAWRKQDGAAVERLVREARQRLGDDSEERERAETAARIQADVRDSIARNLRAVGIRPLTTDEEPPQ